MLDAGVFVQYFLYKQDDEDDEDGEPEVRSLDARDEEAVW
jgi:hypothetical protein